MQNETKYGVTQKGTGAFLVINLPTFAAAKKKAKEINGIAVRYID